MKKLEKKTIQPLDEQDDVDDEELLTGKPNEHRFD